VSLCVLRAQPSLGKAIAPVPAVPCCAPEELRPVPAVVPCSVLEEKRLPQFSSAVLCARRAEASASSGAVQCAGRKNSIAPPVPVPCCAQKS
jgi:hypothetical protein